MQIKSNQFYGYKVQSQDCHQSHVYSYTSNISTNIVKNMVINVRVCLIEQTIKMDNSQHRDCPRFHVEHEVLLQTV